MAESKLRFRIGERRPFDVMGKVMESVAVEWTCEDGFPPEYTEQPVNLKDVNLVFGSLLTTAVAESYITADQATQLKELMKTVAVPHGKMPEIGIICIEGKTREVIHDQLNVAEGTPTSVIMQMCLEKAIRLSKHLGISY